MNERLSERLSELRARVCERATGHEDTPLLRASECPNASNRVAHPLCTETALSEQNSIRLACGHAFDLTYHQSILSVSGIVPPPTEPTPSRHRRSLVNCVGLNSLLRKSVKSSQQNFEVQKVTLIDSRMTIDCVCTRTVSSQSWQAPRRRREQAQALLLMPRSTKQQRHFVRCTQHGSCRGFSARA